MLITSILFGAVEYALPLPVVRNVPDHEEAAAHVCPVTIGRLVILTLEVSSNGSLAKRGGVVAVAVAVAVAAGASGGWLSVGMDVAIGGAGGAAGQLGNLKLPMRALRLELPLVP